MTTIYLFIMLFDAEGTMHSNGYSDRTFSSYLECYEFVEFITESSENVSAVQWRPDFSFRALMIDSSYTMGICTPNEQT